MNYRERLREIADYLRPYQEIWQNEIMLLYPDPVRHFPREWLNELSGIENKQDRIQIDRKEALGLVQTPSLIEHYRRLKELTDVPFQGELPRMPEDHYTFLFVIPKKQHEIRALAPAINELYRRTGAQRIVDIGGGIGLLAQTLVNQYGHRVCSVDQDSKMQQTGLERHQKNAKDKRNLVEYRQVKVSALDPEFEELLDEQTMSVGLHTCGDLAVAQIDASLRSRTKALVNFGCCYHKLETNPQALNLSQFVKELGHIEIGRFALTLACRAHRKLPEKDYDFKLLVKRFRYVIHFLLTDHYGQKEQLPLGNSDRRLYEGKFSQYALEQFSRMGITPKHTPEELDAYFKDPQRQAMLQDMISAGIIRDSFGRLLELYILLDRLIYLEENGYKAQLLQCFDEVISPRNLGIFAHREDGGP